MKVGILMSLLFMTMHLNADAQFDRKEAFDIITNADRIETGRIGESGEISKVASAFIGLLDSGSAKSTLTELFRQSKSDASRLYALTGLWKMDRARYEVFVREMNLTHEVEAIWFGVKRKETVARWLEIVESGQMLKAITWNPKQ
jgi:hypothetical protein